MKIPKDVKISWEKNCFKKGFFKICLPPLPKVKIETFDFGLEEIGELLEKLRNILLGIPGLGELYQTVEKGVDLILQSLFPLNIQLPLPKLDFSTDSFNEKIEQMSEKLFDRFTQLDFDLYGDLFQSIFQVDFLGDMMSKIPTEELGMPDIFDLESLVPDDCDDFTCVIPNVAGFEYLNGIDLSQLENSAEKVLRASEATLDNFVDAFGEIIEGISDCTEYTPYPIPFLNSFAAAMGLEDCPQLSSINLCSSYSSSLNFPSIGGSIASSLSSLFSDLSGDLNLNINDALSVGNNRRLSAIATLNSPLVIPIDTIITQFVPIDVLLSASRGGYFAWARVNAKVGKSDRADREVKLECESAKKANSKDAKKICAESGIKKVFDDPSFSALNIYFKPEVSVKLLLFYPMLPRLFRVPHLILGLPLFRFDLPNSITHS